MSPRCLGWTCLLIAPCLGKADDRVETLTTWWARMEALWARWLESLPDPLGPWLGWLSSSGVLSALATTSVATVVLSAVVVPWLLVRLPADYFLQPDPVPWSARFLHRRVSLGLFHLIKNVVGWLLALAGLLMLLLPGQGLLTLLVATFFMDFPRKRDVQHWLVSRRPVLRVVQGMRRRAGRPLLRLRPPPANEPVQAPEAG